MRVTPMILLVASFSILATGLATPVKYQNCGKLNKAFPHGVGVRGARDKTSTRKPVRNFAIRPDVYALNKGLDRDGDGIACERR